MIPLLLAATTREEFRIMVSYTLPVELNNRNEACG